MFVYRCKLQKHRLRQNLNSKAIDVCVTRKLVVACTPISQLMCRDMRGTGKQTELHSISSCTWAELAITHYGNTSSAQTGSLPCYVWLGCVPCIHRASRRCTQLHSLSPPELGCERHPLRVTGCSRRGWQQLCAGWLLHCSSSVCKRICNVIAAVRLQRFTDGTCNLQHYS